MDARCLQPRGVREKEPGIMRPSKLSKEEMGKRCPPPPKELVDCLWDRVHEASGKIVSSTPIKIKPKSDSILVPTEA